MAEGLARHHLGSILEPFSAGTRPKGIDPRASRAMKEIGMELDGQSSKSIDDVDLESLDLIITVCADADENCPVVPADCRVEHQGFDDPPRLAADCTDEESAMKHYRRVRDQIERFIIELPSTGILG